MDKKGQTWLIVFAILFVVLIIGGLIIVLVVGNPSSSKAPKDIPKISVYLTTSDVNSKSQVSANYIILENGTLVSQGTSLVDTPLEVRIPLSNSTDIYCYSKDYYTNSIHKDFTNYDFSFNSSKLDCPMQKIGKLDIKLNGDISKEDNHIILGLTSKDGAIKRLSACFSWSIGLVFIDDSANHPINMEIPNRFKNKVDKCSFYNWTLNQDEKKDFILDVSTFDFKNSFDYLEITFFDQSVYSNNGTYIYEDLAESYGKMNDTSVRINYAP